jgi:hypothetical protein
MKKLLIGLLTAASLIVPAYAEQVYKAESGLWDVVGWREDDGSLACVAKTFWQDGSQININVFPRHGQGEDFYTTMTIYNNGVTTHGMEENRVYVFKLRFVDEGRVYDYDLHTQRFGEKVIVRNLTSEFFQMFADSETMTVFADTDIAMRVGLDGTRYAIRLLEECLSLDE